VPQAVSALTIDPDRPDPEAFERLRAAYWTPGRMPGGAFGPFSR
jgi:hypothetical protein